VIDTKVRKEWPEVDRLRFHCDPERPAVDCPTPLGHHRWEFPVLPGEDRDEVSGEALAVLYAHPERWTRANMVATLDGASTGGDGLTGSINTEPDHEVYRLLRDLADVVLVGAGTARAEGYRRPGPRVRPGRTPCPDVAVVSRSALSAAALTPKWCRAAASAPNTPSPHSAKLRYSSRILSFVNCRSSFTASAASRILRITVRSVSSVSPEPVQAPPAVVFDDVTNGYVP
jgi:hypothetical protein